MSPFVEIPSDFLASIATDEERIPTLYYSENRFVRHFFWSRLRALHRLGERFADPERTCVDFGAGGGVFLPTLSKSFHHVVCVDLVTHEAIQVADRYALENLELIEGDALTLDLPAAPVGTLVAADVLEHFRDLGPPLRVIRGWLRDGGILLTSLPTENFLYVLLRKVFGVEKPKDHYHTAYEVEREIERQGFERIGRSFVPLRIAPLYLVTAWRKRA